MSKTLLIISGGIEAVHAIRQAQRSGLHVVVSDMDPDAPGMRIADDTLVASTYDAAETSSAAKFYASTVRPIDGVIAVGADVPITIAAVVDALGISGITKDAASLAANKLAMKERLQADGVPVPWFAGIASPQELADHLTARKETLVIKPVDSRGSRGVQRVKTGDDLELAFDRAMKESPSESVMVEAYLSGPQVSTESFVIDGKAFTPGFSDRNYELLDQYAPFFIENGGDLPSHLPGGVQKEIHQVVEQAARSMGLSQTTVKGDIVVHNGQAYVIELAARLSGGYFCTLEIPLNTGVDFIGNAIKLALDEPIDVSALDPQFQKPVVQRYKFTGPGRIVGLSGIEKARRIPGVEEVIASHRIGDVIPPVESTKSRVVMVLTTGTTIDDATKTAQQALETIDVKTVPVDTSLAATG